MTTILDDLTHLVSQLDGQVSVLLVQLVLLLRHVLGLHLLESEAVELEDLAQVLRLDDAVGKLPMEQPASLGEAQVRLRLHVLGIEEVVQLNLVNGGQGHPFGPMQLARVELRWLDALPLDQELLLGEVMPHHPLYLLIWQTQQLGDDTQGDDGLRLKNWFLGAIAEEEHLPEDKVFLLLVLNVLHAYFADDERNFNFSIN